MTAAAIGWNIIHKSMRLRDFRGLSGRRSHPNAFLALAGVNHPVALSLGL